MSNNLKPNSVKYDSDSRVGHFYTGPNIPSAIPGLTFPQEPRPKMESIVAELLDKAGVPNFIWGEPVLSVLGVPTSVFFTAFVIPDLHIEKAAQALTNAKFPLCTQGHDACTVFWDGRAHPYPDYHWHTDLRYMKCAPAMAYGTFLYRKSRLFWSFPDPPIGAPPQNDPYYILTSDKHIAEQDLPRGRASDKDYPVKMPLPARYTESMMLLELRDLDGQGRCDHWAIEINNLMELIKASPNLCINDLREPFREWARRYADDEYSRKTDDLMGQRFALELHVKMKKRDELPPPEPGNEWLASLEDRMRKHGVKWSD
ncbi:hypothetical protein BJY00DRAFT_308395 [Aspergillus carlsbadensis]|nr:hypothetical protein BJY00DRAFT_308395 [Aspergillus carlsbadensis]